MVEDIVEFLGQLLAGFDNFPPKMNPSFLGHANEICAIRNFSIRKARNKFRRWANQNGAVKVPRIYISPRELSIEPTRLEPIKKMREK